METSFLSEDGIDLSISALELTTNDLDGITHVGWDRVDIVLCSQFLAEVAAHDLSPDDGEGREVELPGLSTLA